LIYIIKNQNKKKNKVDFVIGKVKQSGGIDYAVKKMNDYKQEALQILNEFPDTDSKKALIDLVSFVTDRKY